MTSTTHSVHRGIDADRRATTSPSGGVTSDAGLTSGRMPVWSRVRDGAADAEHRAELESFAALADKSGGGLQDHEVATVVEAWSRQVASAHAEMLRWITVLRQRALHYGMGPDWNPRDSVVGELQALLGIARRRAGRLVDDASALTGGLYPVLESLKTGAIDAGKAQIFAEVLEEQSLEAQIGVVEATLESASELNHASLRRALHDALVEIDPDGVQERTASAIARRRVNKPQHTGDGMASFGALLPAPAAAALDRVCEAAARAIRMKRSVGAAASNPGELRNLDQLRADVLATMAEHALVTGQVGADGITAETFYFDPDQARVRIIATEMAQRGHRQVSVGDALRWEMATPEGRECDPSEPGSYDEVDPPGEVVPGWDVPVLEGFGAIPAGFVPSIGAERWVQVVEPVDLHDVPPPAPGYRPTAELDRWVRARFPVCLAPGCGVGSRLCDLDHVVPFPHGETDVGNLRPLCRFHHRLKTLGGHSYEVAEDGALVWRTAAGQVLRQRRGGRVEIDDWPDAPARVRPEDLDVPEVSDEDIAAWLAEESDGDNPDDGSSFSDSAGDRRTDT